MTEIEKLNNKIDEKFDLINKTWEQFKETNSERLKQIETKSSVDPLTEIKLEKLNDILDEVQQQKDKVEKIETAIARPYGDISNGDLSNQKDIQYKMAFGNYLKKGIDDQLYKLEQKRDLTTSIENDSSYGGFLLSPNLQKMITDNLQERCVMRKICSVQEISTASFEVLSGSSMEPSWVNETGTITDTDSSIFSKKTINTHDLVAQPKVSQRMLDDSAINIEEWLANRIADDFAMAEENAFINGTGDEDNKPTGILNYVGDNSIETINSTATSGFFTANEIMDLYYSLGSKYINNASFLLSRTAIKEIRKLKDSTSGQYLWNPSLLANQPSMLLGCPVYTSEHMPTVVSNSFSIIVGDFKYYQIVDRIGIRILRDPYTAKPYVRFFTTKRVGGDVVDTNAFKVLKSK